MTRNSNRMIVITDGFLMHIPVIHIHHRHYPEIRGEGRSRAEAFKHLTRLLTRCLERAAGPRRAAMEQALQDVRAAQSAASQPASAVTS